MGTLYFIFSGLSTLFSILVAPVYIPTDSVGGFLESDLLKWSSLLRAWIRHSWLCIHHTLCLSFPPCRLKQQAISSPQSATSELDLACSYTLLHCLTFTLQLKQSPMFKNQCISLPLTHTNTHFRVFFKKISPAGSMGSHSHRSTFPSSWVPPPPFTKDRYFPTCNHPHFSHFQADWRVCNFWTQWSLGSLPSTSESTTPWPWKAFPGGSSHCRAPQAFLHVAVTQAGHAPQLNWDLPSFRLKVLHLKKFLGPRPSM